LSSRDPVFLICTVAAVPRAIPSAEDRAVWHRERGLCAERVGARL